MPFHQSVQTTAYPTTDLEKIYAAIRKAQAENFSKDLTTLLLLIQRGCLQFPPWRAVERYEDALKDEVLGVIDALDVKGAETEKIIGWDTLFADWWHSPKPGSRDEHRLLCAIAEGYENQRKESPDLDLTIQHYVGSMDFFKTINPDANTKNRKDRILHAHRHFRLRMRLFLSRHEDKDLSKSPGPWKNPAKPKRSKPGEAPKVIPWEEALGILESHEYFEAAKNGTLIQDMKKSDLEESGTGNAEGSTRPENSKSTRPGSPGPGQTSSNTKRSAGPDASDQSLAQPVADSSSHTSKRARPARKDQSVPAKKSPASRPNKTTGKSRSGGQRLPQTSRTSRPRSGSSKAPAAPKVSPAARQPGPSRASVGARISLPRAACHSDTNSPNPPPRSSAAVPGRSTPPPAVGEPVRSAKTESGVLPGGGGPSRASSVLSESRGSSKSHGSRGSSELPHRPLDSGSPRWS